MKNQPGDWVAIEAPGAEGGYRPGKVVEADRDRVVVEVRFDGESRRLSFDTPQRRIRWQRQRGRARWQFA